nr:hypothetical protein [Tanacetum cinerariifolium]
MFREQYPHNKGPQMRGARGRAYAINGGICDSGVGGHGGGDDEVMMMDIRWWCSVGDDNDDSVVMMMVLRWFGCGGGGDGGWRVMASDIGDRIDRVTGNIFGVRQKSFPMAVDGGGQRLAGRRWGGR